MKNVLVNVKTSWKKVMERKPESNLMSALKIIRNISVGVVLAIPKIVFAADPTGIVTGGLGTLTNSLLLIAVVAGGLAFSWFGILYNFAGEAHDKATYAKYMKSTVLITALVGLGPTIISWIASIFHG